MCARAIALASLRVPAIVVVPLIVRQVFDEAIPRGDGRAITVLGIGLFVAYAADAAIANVTRRRAATFASQAVADLRTNLAVHVYSLPRSWHDDQDPGVLHAITMNDAERLLVV